MTTTSAATAPTARGGARTYYVGVTRRGGRNNPSPLRHIHTHAPASRWGFNTRALCGTSIWPYIYAEDGINSTVFDPDHPRACRACVKAIR